MTIFATFRQDAGDVSTNSSYESLRAAIVGGDIAPDARLVEADISATFGMSRGAVRTALIRLEQDGLVVREPHRGARVRKVSDEEAVEILEARAVLEGLAVRQTAARIDEDGAARVKACLARHGELLEAGDLLGASDANADLHATCSSCRGTGRLSADSALSSQTVRYQYRTILIPGARRPRWRSTGRSWTRVVASTDEAEAAMRSHLFNVAESVRRGLLGDRRGEPRCALRTAGSNALRLEDRSDRAVWYVRRELLTTLVLIWLIRTCASPGGHRIPIPVARTMS